MWGLGAALGSLAGVAGDSTSNWHLATCSRSVVALSAASFRAESGTRMMRPMIRTTIRSHAGARSLLGIVFPAPRVLLLQAQLTRPG